MTILKDLVERLGENQVSEAHFEGANIVLYTREKDLFLNGRDKIKDLAKEFKKRISVRMLPKLCSSEEDTRNIISKLIPKDAGVDHIIFDPPRSTCIIHAEKPGLITSKSAEHIHNIKNKTGWAPEIKRVPPIKSKLIDSIRSVLYENADYRKKFLNQLGESLYQPKSDKKPWVRLSFLGAGRQVGRSCLLVQTPQSTVIMDCGIDPGAEGHDAHPFLDAPEFDISKVDAVILSHAHLDHSGLVPLLYKYGYRGPVYCTAPTRDVSALLLLDSIKIMHSEGKDGYFTSEDVTQFVLHTIPLDWESVTDITPDLRLTLYNSGHILGSSIIHLNVNNGFHNLVYTADMKYARTNVLEPAHTYFPRVETLIVESTYGGKGNVLAEKEADEYMVQTIIDTFNRGGKVLMPVLGSGRAQEVMVICERLMREGRIPKAPTYIDGMLWDITAIHTAYPEFLGRNLREQIFNKGNNPFLSEMFKRVGSSKERKEVIDMEGSCLILATSGMLTGGPSVQYLKSLCEDKRHSLIFSCYQPRGSLGHRIREGDKQIQVAEDGKMRAYNIQMDVHKVEITSHSDRRQLMNYIKRCQPTPRKVVVQHGESSRCLDLASSIYKTFRIETVVPRNLETLRLR